MLCNTDDDTYVLELPDTYGASPTFNVGDLSPYYPPDEDEGDSRSNPLQEGENDEGSSESSQPIVEGAITKANAKKLQQELDDLVDISPCQGAIYN